MSDDPLADRRRLIEEFLSFAAFTWREEIPEFLPGAWLEELAGVSVARLNSALQRARRSKFFPNIGDVLEIVDGLVESARIADAGTTYKRLAAQQGKPPDWEPLSANEQARLFQKFETAVTTTAQEKAMRANVTPIDTELQLRKLRKQAADLLRARKSQEGVG